MISGPYIRKKLLTRVCNGIKENPWHFALKPEVGLLWEILYSTMFKVAGKYYYGLKSGDLENQGYFSISVGFAFKL